MSGPGTGVLPTRVGPGEIVGLPGLRSGLLGIGLLAGGLRGRRGERGHVDSYLAGAVALQQPLQVGYALGQC
ncbi:MAG TPA: hypothetical protein PLZ93_12255, partial [Nocardioides sp.]|nr:hypothetical protein [Nocardioides sp.]